MRGGDRSWERDTDRVKRRRDQVCQKKNVEQELVDGAVLQSQLKINVSGPELWTRVQVLKQSVHTDKSVLAAVMIFIQVLFLEKKKTRE